MASFEEHVVRYDSGSKEIAYLSHGPITGPLLVFIHGYPAIAMTWKSQLNFFANLGYRVIAPDMPGYGNSTSTKNIEDYSHQRVIEGLLAMLNDIGQPNATWIAHDWGCGVLSSLAAVHPEVCKALVWLGLPYKTIELGIEELVKTVDRDMYPVDQYPYGQWDYQVYFEANFENVVSWFEKDIAGITKVVYAKGDPTAFGKPSASANISKDGGWFGGAPAPPPAAAIPFEIITLDEELFNHVSSALQKTGYYAPTAYYLNHKRNRAFNLAEQKNDGILTVPCLFVQAKYDTICDTIHSTLLDAMKDKYCKDFTFANVDAGHWVALEKPDEVNDAILGWLREKVTGKE